MVIRQGDELVTAYAGENQPNGRKVANAVIIAVPKEAPINTDDLTDAIAKAEGMKKADYSASAKEWQHHPPPHTMAHPTAQLYPRRGHHTQCEQSGGRRIGRLQAPLDEDGAVVDHHRLKEQIRRDGDGVNPAKQQNVGVYLANSAAADPLM